jgi:hypothetical protein
VAFAGAAVALLGLAVAVRAGGLAPFQAYPVLHAPVGGEGAAASAALVVAALAPFANRKGIEWRTP